MAGFSLATCDRTLCWKAWSWFAPEVQFPRLNEAQAASKLAMRGRLVFRSRLACSTNDMISSTAWPQVTTVTEK